MDDKPQNAPKQNPSAPSEMPKVIAAPMNQEQAHTTVEQYATIMTTTHGKLDLLRQQMPTPPAVAGEAAVNRGTTSNG